MQRLLQTSRKTPRKDANVPQRSTCTRNVVVALIASLAVVFCVVAVASSHTDHASSCSPPYNIAKYRGIGVASGVVYSRVVAFKEDVDPLVSAPTPQEIVVALSTVVVDDDSGDDNPQRASALVWAWLQFIGHDLSLPLSRNGAAENGLLDYEGLVRDDFHLDSHGNRQTVNYASPFLDLSQIYGNAEAETTLLRRADGTGKLRTEYTQTSMQDSEFPPLNTSTGDFLYVDARSSENVVVAALYALFVREHNYWCDRLHDDQPGLTDFEYFNIARHITIAEMQAVTYRVVLPLLFGDVDTSEAHCFDGVEKIKVAATVDDYVHRASVFNEVGTALLQVFAALATPSQPQTNVSTYLREAGVANVFIGESSRLLQGRRKGLSLLAESQHRELAQEAVARTRDHQIPLYEHYRKHYNTRETHSATCYSYARQETCDALLPLYGEGVKHLDFFTGLLLEHQTGSLALFGEVGRRLAVEQFGFVKNNDHYFYLWDRVVQPYISEIHHSNLGKIVARNTGVDYTELHHNLFVVAS